MQRDYDRFWKKVAWEGKTEDDCWEWQGYRGDKGYGQFGVAYEVYSSHRIAWAFANGWEIPPSEDHVLHSCDNPPCCNPKHLSIGGIQRNNKEMLERGRAKWGHLPRFEGEGHFNATLTEEKVLEIRHRLHAGESGTRLAAEYGVKPATISAIRYNRIWKNVGGPVRVPGRR